MTVWYIARGTGLAALVLLTLSTCFGIVMSGRGTAAQRVVASYVHRVTASLGLTALLVHFMAILADSFAKVGWLGALVPFSSAFRPTWIGLGSLAAYTFLLVAAVGFARGRIAASAVGARVWRGLHGLAYVGWSLAMLHGLNSGTDTRVGWVQALYIGCGVAVAGASIARATGFAPQPKPVDPSSRRRENERVLVRLR